MNPYRLIIHDLCKSFETLPVLNHLNLTLESGHTYCLMGSSGTGKTTLIRLLLGLEKPDAGSVTCLWLPTKATAPVANAGSVPIDSVSSARLVAVFQEDRLCEAFSPLENIRLTTYKALTREQVYTELCCLLPEESVTRPVHTLSGGMKRRVAIARALLAPSDGILMDEPFTGLDETTKRHVISYINKKTGDRLLLVATHQKEDADLLHAQILHPF